MGRPLAKALFAASGLLCIALQALGQTLSPPIAEYRKKANGEFTLSNEGDFPLAAIMEVRDFSVGQHGAVAYGGPSPGVTVRFGSSSFVIPPHQAHYVFYSATCKETPCWFAVMNTLTRASPIQGGLRINIILPYLVYIYQKAKMKKKDVRVSVERADPDGSYRLTIQNLTAKLGRVDTIESEGFATESSYGSFPLFPRESRELLINPKGPSKRPRFRINFEDGLRLNVPAPESEMSSQAAR